MTSTARVWLSRLTLVALLACATPSGPATETDALCPGTCIHDGGRHEVVTVGCSSDSQCPAGTRCGYQSPAHFGPDGSVTPLEDLVPETCRPLALPVFGQACSQDTGPEPTCVHDDRAPRIDALRRIWDVPRFELVMTAPGVFQWDAPKRTVSVSCALFRCAPQPAPFVRDGETRGIGNLDRCAVAAALPTDAYVFDLNDPLPDHRVLADYGCTDETEREVAVTSFLRVGCWAYDALDLIAASDLVAIAPQDAGFYSTVAVAEGDCADNDGTSCVLESDPLFGVCHGGACVRRCVTDEDCVDGGPACCVHPDVDPHDGVADDYVGACVAEPA